MQRIARISLLTLCLSACAHAPSAPAVTAPQPIDEITLADHHAHLFTPAVRRWLENELKLPKPLPALSTDELVAIVQKDGVDKAAVLSNAYFFERPGAIKPDAMRSPMEENDLVAAEVAKHPNQLVGFFSVNPLADWALAEIDRCVRLRRFAGLKLHLANSEVDLRNPAHVERLAAVFERANAAGIAIVIHMRTQRSDYGREDALIFIDQLLVKTPDVPIQIAHAAGWGGYDQATDAALGAFADRLTERKLTRTNLYFDVSAVVRGVGKTTSTAAGAQSAEPVWLPAKRYERLVERLRKIGLDRILFGSDWPEWTPRAYATDLGTQLPLHQHELRTLLTNRAPWLE